MPTLVDSYSETNQDSNARLTAENVVGARYAKYAQSFDSGAGGEIDSCKFFISKVGSPTGNATAVLYAHTGTYGTDGRPTGAALGTSDTLDVSTLGTSNALVTFNFTGANRYVMAASTKYCIAIEYGGGDASNRVSVGYDASSPTHSGNASDYETGVWVGAAPAGISGDVCFYVYVPTIAAPVPMRRRGMFFGV